MSDTETPKTVPPVTYTVTSGAPVVVNVVRGDEKYTLRVGLTIFDVRDTGRMATGEVPLFEVDASISVNATKS